MTFSKWRVEKADTCKSRKQPEYFRSMSRICLYVLENTVINCLMNNILSAQDYVFSTKSFRQTNVLFSENEAFFKTLL